MKQFFFTSFCLCCLLWMSCSDDPNSVGIGLVPPQDSVAITSFDTSAISASSYLTRISGSSTRLLMGKSNQIETRTLLQFSGMPTNVSSPIIDTAILRVPITYRFLDSTGTLSLEVRRLLRPWAEDSLRWDSTNVSSLVSSIIDTIYQRPIFAGDSIIEIPVTQIVRAWLQDSLISPYGLILIPTAASNIITGCSTLYDIYSDGRPELYVVYRGASDTTTTTISRRPFQQLFLSETSAPVVADSLFIVQAGVAHRGILKFDFTNVPRQASISKALLEVTINPGQSLRNSFSTNTLIAHLALDEDASPSLSGITSSGTFASDTARTVTIDVRTLVQQSISNNQNYGIVLRASSEFIAVDRYALYSQTASDSLKRPRLTIIYTILP